jgi:hypothetical protein
MIYLTMDLPEQPPPDAPAPPPGPEAVRSRDLMRWIIGVGVLSAIGVFVIATAPIVHKAPKLADLTEARNNLRQLHLALLDFDSDYGSFPAPSTIADVKAATHTDVPLGTTSSNELLRQMLVSVAKSERVFWAKSTITPRKPDNVVNGSHALEKGECAFAYVASLSSSDNPGMPVLMTPVDPAKRCFERRKDYGEKAVVLFLDGSVKSLPIDRHGKAQLNGMDLLDSRQPFWGGKAPDVKWPE